MKSWIRGPEWIPAVTRFTAGCAKSPKLSSLRLLRRNSKKPEHRCWMRIFCFRRSNPARRHPPLHPHRRFHPQPNDPVGMEPILVRIRFTVGCAENDSRPLQQQHRLRQPQQLLSHSFRMRLSSFRISIPPRFRQPPNRLRPRQLFLRSSSARWLRKKGGTKRIRVPIHFTVGSARNPK